MVVCQGSNEPGTRMRVSTEFAKGKTEPELIALLQAEYRGSKGFETGRGKLNALFDREGIRLSRSTAVQHNPFAQLLPWEDAVRRVGQLLEQGEYATQDELYLAGQQERRELAQGLLYLCQNLADHAKGYLPEISKHHGGFPENTEAITAMLDDPVQRRVIVEEVRLLTSAYAQDRSLLRFHQAVPAKLLSRLVELEIPRKAYTSQLTKLPEARFFITQDEIDSILASGSGIAGGKDRIREYFGQKHTLAENAAFLKAEYGTGGRTHALSGATGSYEDHGSKGIRLRKTGCEEVQLSWNTVAKRIAYLIDHGRYEPERPRPAEMENEYESPAGDKAAMEPVVDKSEPPSEPQAQPQAELETELQTPPTTLEESTAEPPLSIGDKLYLEDGRAFIITDLGTFDIQLQDPTLTYPIFRLESRESLVRLLARYPQPEKAEPPEAVPFTDNYRITDDHLGEGGAKTKYTWNVAAIRTLQTLEAENRPATPQEQETLSRYVGWGGLPQVFDDRNTSWEDEYAEVKGLLSDAEYASARASTLNAHYTSPTVIRAIYEIVQRMGFTSGNILEIKVAC